MVVMNVICLQNEGSFINFGLEIKLLTSYFKSGKVKVPFTTQNIRQNSEALISPSDAAFQKTI